MSLPVAIQSAVFYFVACTPCAKARHRQKAKGKAKKERQEKAKIEAEQPERYRHPAPFNTNPHWHEEIKMGPSLPKKAASKNSSQRGLASSGRESSALSVSEHTTSGDSRINFAEGLSATPEHDAITEDWNRRRGYQREDEELWGQSAGSGHKLMDAFSRARDSAGRLIDATLGIDKEVTESERRDFYFPPRNPSVNDYHPPVVSSRPPHPNARKWMLQPPPPAAVMEGRVPVLRAVSNGSRSSGTTLKPDDARLRPATRCRPARDAPRMKNVPTESELIESLFVSRSQRSLSYTRSRSLSLNDSDESTEPVPQKRRRSKRQAPPAASLRNGTEGQHENEPGKQTAGRPPQITVTDSSFGNQAHPVPQRPPLETIPSADTGSNGRSMSKRSIKRSKPRTRTRSWVNSPVGDDTE